MSSEAQKHYGYGSGSPGCLFDNGPNYGGTSKADAAASALAIFQSELSEEEYDKAHADLVENEIHYFPDHRRHDLGASIVQIFKVSAEDYPDEIEESAE